MNYNKKIFCFIFMSFNSFAMDMERYTSKSPQEICIVEDSPRSVVVVSDDSFQVEANNNNFYENYYPRKRKSTSQNTPIAIPLSQEECQQVAVAQFVREERALIDICALVSQCLGINS